MWLVAFCTCSCVVGTGTSRCCVVVWCLVLVLTLASGVLIVIQLDEVADGIVVSGTICSLKMWPYVAGCRPSESFCPTWFVRLAPRFEWRWTLLLVVAAHCSRAFICCWLHVRMIPRSREWEDTTRDLHGVFAFTVGDNNGSEFGFGPIETWGVTSDTSGGSWR